MGKIIAVGNIKGGVGKTTIAVNLAVNRRREGNSVVLVDADEQGTATEQINCFHLFLEYIW